jgi:hypothetical protein
MNSKCPRCGLVNFATAETCKRCNADLSSALDSAASCETPVAPNRESSVRLTDDHPVISWIITIVLLIFNATVTYYHASQAHVPAARAFGQVCGSEVGWPAILLIIYGVSRKFRERYAFLTVINYGLAINAVVNWFMVVR